MISSSEFIARLQEKINLPKAYLDKKQLVVFELPNIEELAKILNKLTSEIISFFWDQGYEEINKNKVLSLELLKEFSEQQKIKVLKKEISFNPEIEEFLDSTFKTNRELTWIKRCPVIGVMGHIDHGKTTLINTICQTKVQKKESGGITQQFKLFETTFQEKKVFFFDTPGHSDFLHLREKGIRIIDAVILVIDLEEGVKEQTKEIIQYVKKNSLSTVIFLNQKKKEFNSENISRIYAQLQNEKIEVLEWGGEFPTVIGSAKEKAVAEKVLESVFLLFEEPKANLNGPVHGVVIDSFYFAKLKTKVLEVLIQGGILKNKQTFFLNGQLKQIKTIFLEQLQIKTAKCGEIVRLITTTPLESSGTEIGEKLIILTENETKFFSDTKIAKNTSSDYLLSAKKKVINFFLLSDSENKLQTLAEILTKKKVPNFELVVVGKAIQKIKYSELEFIKLSKSVVLTFNVYLEYATKSFFKENQLLFFECFVIYQIDDLLKEILKEQKQEIELVEVLKGKAKIKIVYPFSKGNIAGCRIISGTVERSHRVNIFRNNKKIYSGRIKSLEVEKESTKEARAGQECGITLEKFNDYQAEDELTFFSLEEKTK